MQRTARVILYFIVVLAVFSSVSAQSRTTVPAKPVQPANQPKTTNDDKVYPCPTVAVQPVARQLIRDGDKVVFSANIAGGDPKVVPTILWSTSAGVIAEGQSTRRIIVDSTGAGSTPDREIKADVWIGGYAPECVSQSSASIKVTPPATKFGDFGELPPEAVAKNLKALADFLATTPDTVWLIVYAGRNSERGYAATRAREMKAALVADGVSARRIIAIDGGYMEQPLFDFWIVPFGAQPPQPKPTIDRREIVSPRVRRPTQ